MVSLTVFVDSSICQGHARCAAVAPAVFDLDDRGYCAFDEKSLALPLEQQARAGERACPERAIVIRERLAADETV